MQRLTERFRHDDQGAVAIVVALVMVVLLGMAAISVDVSASWGRKHQLQNGADAGALAVAQNCAGERPTCSTPLATAQSYVTANSYGGTANALVVGPTAGVVTVKATDPSYKHWFAPVLDPKFSSSVIGASATAKWGWPTAGSTIPLTFSWCEWQAQVGGVDSTTPHVIDFPKKAATGCNGPSGLPIPAGFGWLDSDGTCHVTTDIAGVLPSDPGNAAPDKKVCEDYFKSLVGTTILIPIFDIASDAGRKGKYYVYGYAAFKLIGYDLDPKIKAGSPPPTCIAKGSGKCIEGYFTRFVDLSEALETGVSGPKLGAAVVTLIK